jgi:hypothetical protein
MILEQTYNDLCSRGSDINEHLPVLRQYANECDHITEMGVRWIESTFALLIANPETLISIDLNHPTDYSQGVSRWETLNKCVEEVDTDFTFIQDNTNTMDIEETDFLFIDTWHVYDCLKVELERHGNKARKYLGFHDTTSFEVNGETAGHKGIWPAIQEFLDDNPHWKIKERRTNNNGLTILERKWD